MLPEVTVKERAVKKVRNYYLWVYADELQRQPAGLPPGEIVRVAAPGGQVLGTGFYHPGTRVALRLFHPAEVNPDPAFWDRKVARALELRESLKSASNALRLVYAEGDYLPGLIVDGFDGHLAVQFRTAGVDRLRDTLLEVLQRRLRPVSVYERSDMAARAEEGLALRAGQLAGETPDRIRVAENGVDLWVDLKGGQKTGFFTDQRDARRHFAELLRPGDRVLDAFCYTGAFGLYACRRGAEVLAADKDGAALRLAEANAALNGCVDRFRTLEADLFWWLPEAAAAGRKFDAICLDPPALVKYKNQQGKGRGLLMDLIRPCLRMLSGGGLLHVSSCAYHLGTDVLREAVRMAAGETGRRLLVVGETTQAADHPHTVQMPELLYLKGFTFRVLED